eukprot:m.489485 g.489485  ORF g.489485 m.489485 type:complete len:341 (+) comp21768_c1_seq1:50-1072(+)
MAPPSGKRKRPAAAMEGSSTPNSSVPRKDSKKASKKKVKSKKEIEATPANDALSKGDSETQVIGRKLASPRWTNRQRTLVFSSRGVSYRSRHLMDDLRNLMPHSKKDAKMDRKDKLNETIPEICEMRNCNNCVYFEARKNADLYMWVGKMPHGPTAKFLVQNVHTMSELKMTGNALRGSRAVINFDQHFDELPQLQLLKELFIHAFATPRAHPKSKPFVDRVMSFYWLDNRVWFRNYQVVWSEDKKAKDEHELTEIGPRFCLNPIRIFGGSFGGNTLFENPFYVSPNESRRAMKATAGQKFRDRAVQKQATEQRKDATVFAKDDVEDVFADAALAADEDA